MANWDERYASGEFTTAEPHRLLIGLIPGAKPGKALDLACGAGRNSLFLAENGWRVTGCDSSRVAIEIARQRSAEKDLGVDFRLADLEESEFAIEENAFDLIGDFYFLRHELFPKIKAGLKPGGLVVAAIHIYGEGEEEGRFLLKEGELREIFGDFEILHYHETSAADTDAAKHHRRTAEIIAKKSETM